LNPTPARVPGVLILACGNPSRGDDALGPALIERLAASPQVGAEPGQSFDLLTDFQLQIEHALDLKGRERVIFVDAALSGPEPFAWNWVVPDVASSFTTHAMSPGALLRVYGQVVGGPLPECRLLAIRGYSFELGAGLSPQAAANLDAAVAFLLSALLPAAVSVSSMSQQRTQNLPGPFRADQLHEGDRYELSGGHPIYCVPSGPEHAARNLTGAAVLETDPDVEWAGVDAGFAPERDMLRAPDIAIAPPAMVAGRRGWIPDVPPLAVEYASHGQDEDALQAKITDLLGKGTRAVWVVRLVGPRRVEVYRPGEPVQVLGPGEQLTAPGMLRNPVPVEALYDRDAGHRATFRNLLQRLGYEDLDQVRDEGREQGRAEGLAIAILTLLRGRGIPVPDAAEQRIRACTDVDRLAAWLLAAASADRAERVFEA
jgi:hydrogenase maturation protease